MTKQKWITVYTHRSYQIKILDGATHDIGYTIDDPAFTQRYNTVAEAVEAIDEATK